MTQANNNYFEIELTAPGKIILFGEHSVVYGKKAIAATLGLYTKLRLIENGSDKITLQLPCISFEEAFPINIVREYFKRNDNSPAKNCIQSTAEIFQGFYSRHGTKSLTEGQRYSLLTFFHSLAYSDIRSSGFLLEVHTDLPISSGAGSSASFSVIVVTAMILFDLAKSDKLAEFVTRNGQNGSFTITDELKDIISERVFLCESIFHGTPSGIDHSVILRGYTLEFIKGSSGNTLTSIDGSTIRVLLVDTKIPRSTKKQVEILKNLKEKFPDTVQNILDAMGNIARDAVEILSSLKMNEGGVRKNESRLADLIDLNHGLLRSVGLSHNSLEKACSIAKNYKLSAKLTGAGGGGLSFVYLPSDTPPETVANLKNELMQAGFGASEVILGGPGLSIKSLSL